MIFTFVTKDKKVKFSCFFFRIEMNISLVYSPMCIENIVCWIDLCD